MKISIISASQRPDSQSRKVAEYIQKEISKKEAVTEVFWKDLIDSGLPFFDDTLEENPAQQELWNPIAKELAESNAFVFITPEWNGMASPMLKNFFMYVDMELAQKPALLVSVTAGMTNGAYPIAELRASSYKNNYVCYIPNHVIVRKVGDCFLDEVVNPENKSDVIARNRIDYSLDVLVLYGKALSDMRKNTAIDWNQFDSGM